MMRSSVGASSMGSGCSGDGGSGVDASGGDGSSGNACEGLAHTGSVNAPTTIPTQIVRLTLEEGQSTAREHVSHAPTGSWSSASGRAVDPQRLDSSTALQSQVGAPPVACELSAPLSACASPLGPSGLFSLFCPPQSAHSLAVSSCEERPNSRQAALLSETRLQRQLVEHLLHVQLARQLKTSGNSSRLARLEAVSNPQALQS